MANEDRYRGDVYRRYEGEGIVVHWQPGFCIHTANCLRHLPLVFDPNARPWVNVSMATADEIAAAVESCPSGALSYERTDRTPQAVTGPVTVEPRPGGPLFLRGPVEVLNARGEVVRSATRLALCRCGGSANKPYCDNSHLGTGFKT